MMTYESTTDRYTSHRGAVKSNKRFVCLCVGVFVYVCVSACVCVSVCVRIEHVLKSGSPRGLEGFLLA